MNQRIQPKATSHRRRVALMVETSLASGRDILRGIARFVREHEPWSLYYEPRSLEETLPGWLANWDGDGIIVRLQNQSIARAAAAAGVPVVDVLGVAESTPFPLVHVDDALIARLAAVHLFERGFRNFGFFGIAGENWSGRRRDAFSRHVQSLGCATQIYELPRRPAPERTWEKLEDDLAQWVARLPKPCGVMVCSDQRGPQFLEGCRRAGAAVPDEIAVVGVDNDEPLCEVCNPPLSSVRAGHEPVGYHAANLLDRLMNGQPPPPAPLLIEPQGIVTRLSTDVLAVEDRRIVAALRYIREHACAGIAVTDIARHAGLSRSVLQRRFRAQLKRTVHEEILLTRLKRARELIAETALPLVEVAEKTGFKHQEYLGAVFKSHFRRTPAQYRRETQGGR